VNYRKRPVLAKKKADYNDHWVYNSDWLSSSATLLISKNVKVWTSELKWLKKWKNKAPWTVCEIKCAHYPTLCDLW
jgi:hypothetical protein